MTVTVQPTLHRPAPSGRWGSPHQRQRAFGFLTVVAGLLIVVMTYFPTVFVISNSLKSGHNLFTNGVFTLFTQFDYQNYVVAWSGVAQPLLNTVIVASLSIVIGVVAAALGAFAFSQLKVQGEGATVHGLRGAVACAMDTDPYPVVPDHSKAPHVQHLVGAGVPICGERTALACVALPRVF